jgi:uncharacterized protein
MQTALPRSSAAVPSIVFRPVMKLHADSRSGSHIVTGHGPGWVAVDGQRHERSLLLTPERIAADWGPDNAAALTEAHLASLAGLAGHIVLLGTGARQRFPAAPLLRPLVAAGIAIEVMDTGAACRTYNVLVAEGRAVAAALIVE